MTSNINPNNIDGAYPVAGQDNNSQGFRDNFTNTKTNFAYAEAEINDLQSKAVLKQALTGTTLDNNMGGSLLYNLQTQQVGQTRVALGSVNTTQTIDFTLGSYYTLTLTGSINLSLDGFPANGIAGSVIVIVTVPAASGYTITLPASVSINTAGIQGFDTSTNTFTFPLSGGTFAFEISTINNGTTYTLNQVNNQLLPFNNSSEDLANAGAANLALTTSYFSTGGAETATLAAGIEGQVKVLAMYADGGNMVITVTNAGWKASGTGTITFTDIGQTVTLMYINSKWFAVGQGAGVGDTLATFA